MSNKLRIYTSRYPVRSIVIFLILSVIVVPLWIGITNKAFGVCSYNNPDGTCYTSAQMAKKFRHNKIIPVQGFDPRTEFAHPKAARKVFISRIATAFTQLTAKHQMAVRVAMNATATGRSDWFICDATCVAGREYNRAVNKASCIGDDLYYGIVPGICQPNNHHPFTKAGIQAAGAVAFCGTLTVLGVVGAPETMGATGYLAVFVGGSACGWEAWSAIDPG